MSWHKWWSCTSWVYNVIFKITPNEFFYKTIVIAIFRQRLYHDIYIYIYIFFFSCQVFNNLRFFFDKILPMKKWALDIANGDLGFWYCQGRLSFWYRQWGLGLLILLMRIGLWCCQWKLGFKYCQWELGFWINRLPWV